MARKKKSHHNREVWHKDKQPTNVPKRVREKVLQTFFQSSDIPKVIPNSLCDFCAPLVVKACGGDEFFDEEGYPIGKRPCRTCFTEEGEGGAGAVDDVCGEDGYIVGGASEWKRLKRDALEEDQFVKGVNAKPDWDQDPDQVSGTISPFLALPPELRNRIYELAFTRPEQPVCIPDRLLLPSAALQSTTDVVRTCYSDHTCLPCQLHILIGTASCGLSGVSQQLHHETAFVPYMVNTFSVHSLYYLQAFLEIIGPAARRHLSSLRFVWKLPEEEARSFGLYTATATAYRLLAECKALTKLDVEMDVPNLLTWTQRGAERGQMLRYLEEVPNIELMCDLRGLKDVKFGWHPLPGFLGMHEWVCWLLGVWRLPEGTHYTEAMPIEAELQQSAGGGGIIEYIHWQAE